jgi:molybdopterin-guanine dinucleotide biosynthesis protein A
MNTRGITGIILAGGMGRRMGGVDKGLVDLDGLPFVAHVLARLSPQVGDVLISANQNLDRYGAFGVPVVPDAIGGFAGPLAGLHAGMTAATRDLVVTVPCDSPFLPGDLVGSASRSTRTAHNWRWRAPSTSRIRSSRWCVATCCPT